MTGSASELHRRLPNLLIVGVAKAGTTSLFEYLAQHPDICGAELKELHYFSPLRFGSPPRMTLEDYAAYFPAASSTTYRMEATPVYLYGGRDVARAALDVLPDPRAIVILRDPADRLWSAFRYKKQMGHLDVRMDFDEFITRCEAHLDAPNEPGEGTFRALATGMYASHVEQWLTVFGDRFRVVFFEHMKTDPVGELRELCHWLAVDPTPVSSFTLGTRNQTLQPRSQLVNRTKNAIARRGRHTLRHQQRLRTALDRMYQRLNARPQRDAMTDLQRRRIEALCRATNHRLAELMTANGYTRVPLWLERG